MQLAQLVRDRGVEPQRVLPCLDPGEPSLHEVDGSRHGTQMNPFWSRSALDVGHVAEEGVAEEIPGPFAIESGQDPRIHDAAEGRTVRRAPVVVLDGSADRVAVQLVAERLEDVLQLLSGQQEEEHQHVGLLRELVSIR